MVMVEAFASNPFDSDISDQNVLSPFSAPTAKVCYLTIVHMMLQDY